MKEIKQIPDKKTLQKLFDYKDGVLYWKIKLNNRSPVGSKAGFIRKDGYRMTRINGNRYLNHRLIWVLFNGDIPKGLSIDHIDGDPTNNNIKNLRS